MSKKKKTPSAKLIANYFIWKAQRDKDKGPLTNKKLQKLLFYSQAWNLVFNKKKLFSEDIEAWVHGPTVPIVYVEYKDFGSRPISKDIDTSEFDKINKIEKKLLDEIWDVYGKYDGDYLEELTHNEEPWQKARKGLEIDESSNNTIDEDVMGEYYTQRLKQVAK